MDISIDSRVGDTPAALPVIRGPRWFGTESRSFVLRLEVPLTFEEMVAALYGVVEQDEITSDEDLCGNVAVTLLIEGLPAVGARVARLSRDEEHGVVQSPRFLAHCRHRVAALIAQ
jgi:hypothetical protein